MAEQFKGDGARPTIHDQAFWDKEMEALVEGWRELDDAPLNQLEGYQLAQFVGFVWKAFVRDHALLEQLATEQPPEPISFKPRAKRARVPKGALSSDNGLDAA